MIRPSTAGAAGQKHNNRKKQKKEEKKFRPTEAKKLQTDLSTKKNQDSTSKNLLSPIRRPIDMTTKSSVAAGEEKAWADVCKCRASVG
jgi:hypothetical protein